MRLLPSVLVLVVIATALAACTLVQAAAAPSSESAIVGAWRYSDGSIASVPSVWFAGTDRVEFIQGSDAHNGTVIRIKRAPLIGTIVPETGTYRFITSDRIILDFSGATSGEAISGAVTYRVAAYTGPGNVPELALTDEA